MQWYGGKSMCQNSAQRGNHMIRRNNLRRLFSIPLFLLNCLLKRVNMASKVKQHSSLPTFPFLPFFFIFFLVKLFFGKMPKGLLSRKAEVWQKITCILFHPSHSSLNCSTTLMLELIEEYWLEWTPKYYRPRPQVWGSFGRAHGVLVHQAWGRTAVFLPSMRQPRPRKCYDRAESQAPKVGLLNSSQCNSNQFVQH